MEKLITKPYSQGGTQVKHYCPACDTNHYFLVGEGAQLRWDWNGDMQMPTVWPSIKTEGYSKTHQRMILCHYFITAGKIIYQNDCQHDLRGQTIDLPEYREISKF